MKLIRDKIIKEKYLNSAVSEMFCSGIYRKNHPLQRRADQWDTTYRDGFIATVIKNEDFDSIKLCEQLNENGVTIWLIDGIQRLSTIDKYRNGLFKLGRNIEFPIMEYQVVKRDIDGEIVCDEDDNPIYEIKSFDLRGKGYNDLPKELKMKFENCEMNVVKHLDCTDEEVGYHIRRYNNQKPMNGNQKGITFTDAKCADTIKKISCKSKFFIERKSYTENEKKKGILDRVVMESIMAIFHIDDWKKDVKNMGKYLSENASDEEFDTFRDYLDRLLPIIGKDKYEDLFNSKNSFIWFAVFDRFTKFGLEDEKFGEFLEAFGEELHTKEINGESFDALDENRATKDRQRVIEKISHVEALMKEYFHIGNAKVDLTEQFIVDTVGIDEDDVDLELYSQTLDDLEDRVVDSKSNLLDKKNRLSLLAMTAYGYKNDVDLEPWFEDYATRNNTYLTNQKANYLHMVEDFEGNAAQAA